MSANKATNKEFITINNKIHKNLIIILSLVKARDAGIKKGNILINKESELLIKLIICDISSGLISPLIEEEPKEINKDIPIAKNIEI